MYCFYKSGIDNKLKYAINNLDYQLTNITDIETDTTGSIIRPMNIQENSVIGYIWSTSTNVKFDKLYFNTAPLSPTNLSRGNFDATQSTLFTWTFNDPDLNGSQSAFQIQILKASDSTVVYDTGKVASTTSNYTLPASTLINGIQYQWKVLTWDNEDLQGVWSLLANFTATSAPIVTILSPVNTTLTDSNLIVQWSYSDPQNLTQSAYHADVRHDPVQPGLKAAIEPERVQVPVNP
jgi:hypothetical protein